MSVTPSSTTTATCKDCGTDIDRFYTPGYCSAPCYFSHKGTKALRHIRQTHTICATCFQPIKSIESPPAHTSLTVGPVDHDAVADTTRDVLIGFQYPTEATTVAVAEHTRTDSDNRTPVDDPGPADRAEHTRWACDCGAVDSRHHYLELERVDPQFVMTQFALTLDRCSRTDAIGGAFDLERFRDAVGDHYLFCDTAGVAGDDWIGWATLAGRALYS